MMIQYLHIRNFRSLKDVELKDLGNLTILVGRNSSGKSNLLEALAIFFSDFSVVGGNTAGLTEYHWFDRRTANPIEFQVNFNLSDAEVKGIFPQSFIDDMQSIDVSLNQLTVKRRIKNLQGVWETDALECSGLALIKDDKPQNHIDLAKPLATKYAQKMKIEAEKKASAAEGDAAKTSASLVIPTLGAEKFNSVIQNISALIKGKFRLITQIRDVKNPVANRMTLVDSELQNSLWTLDQSIKGEDEEKYAEIQRTFANVTDKRLDPAQGQVYIRRKERRFPLHLEGGGIQASIQLIFVLKSEIDRCSLFGVEEPEAHAHPELQRNLFNELKSLSETCQLFITTHSSTFTDRTDLKNMWLVKFAEGETRIERTTELGEITEELGIKPSDVLFFADRILFVEGKSEEIVIPVFAKEFDLDLTDTAVISTEGKNKARLNLKTWLKVTRGLLPTFLLLDADAKEELEDLREEGLVQPGKYHVWREGSIESYYPLPLLEKALTELNERYCLEMDIGNIVARVKALELKPDKIDLGKKAKLLDKSWEVLLAESIARLLGAEKQVILNEEVHRALKDSLAP